MEHRCPIHSLPDEILVRIFWHSSSNQQPSTSTCKSASDALWAVLHPEPRFIYADPSVDPPIHPAFDHDYRADDKIPLQSLPTPILADAARNLLIASVCRRWRRITRSYITTLFVRKNIVVSLQDLSNAVACFANLSHLHLSDGSVETLDDAFFTHLATSCGPKLTALHVGRGITHTLGSDDPYCDSRIDLHPVSESGLDCFFQRCSQLQQLSLYCLHPNAKLPASFFQLTDLHTLVLTDASALEAPDLANLSSLTTLLIASLKLTRQQLSNLVRLRSLTSISISQATQVDHPAALPIAQLPKLKSLEFRGCCPELFPSGAASSSVERLLISHYERRMGLRDDIAQLLPRLRELSILECEMFSELPESFTSLSNLETLIISSCEYFYSLPENFGQLPVLKTLVLDALYFRELPDSFCQLTSLETFILTECGEMDQLPDDFCNLTSLQTLCIMHTEEYEYPIPDSIAGFPRLHTLYLRSVSVQQLLPSLPQLTSLTRLELDRCLMEGDLPGDLGKLSNLQQLHISSCPVKRLPASFTALTGLQILTIEHCSPLASIAAGSLHNLTRLKQVDLAGCHVRTEPPHLLPRSLEVLSLELPHRVPSLPDLSMLTNLRRLTLNLEGAGQGAAGICSSNCSSSSSSRSSSSSSPDLKNLEHVEYLDLTIGQAVKEFPFSRFPFPQLRVLKISFGNRIQKLPLHLGCDLPQLRKLQLRSSEGVTELPHSITRLQHLTSLDVGYTSQLASLPDGIGALSRLRRLCLSHCSALQNLPTSLTRLTCLHQLNAEGTCIRTLPSVAQLTRLRWLYLGKCEQLQVLPEGLTDLKLLRFLGVKGSEVAIGSVGGRHAADVLPGEGRSHAAADPRTCGLVYEPVPDLGHFPHFYSPAPPTNASASGGSEAAGESAGEGAGEGAGSRGMPLSAVVQAVKLPLAQGVHVLPPFLSAS
ncbi:unnamed protein product [Closterium sp. Naga37s-1]|nr:unnamed protein product [Closterium sp. Naga37s-1]